MMDMYNLQFLNHTLSIISPVTKDILCSICHKVLCDPFIGSCGCQYCSNCIHEWAKENNICPGNCSTVIDIEANIFKDVKTEKQIDLLLVRCPHQTCKYQCELKNIGEHMEYCVSGQSGCPFASLGCETCITDEVVLDCHLFDECVSHNCLLVNSIMAIKGDLNALKTTEMGGIKKELADVREMLATETAGFRTMLVKLLGDKKKELMEIKSYRNQIEELQQTVLEMNHERNVMETEINELKLRCDAAEDKYDHISALKKKVDENLVKTIELSLANETTQEEIDDLKETMGILKTTEFIWRIDNIIHRRQDAAAYSYNESFDSEPFYSHPNGYLLYLQLYPNGHRKSWGTHLGLCFGILPGEFDDILRWPMRKTIRLSIVNQNDQSDVVSEEFCFDKETVDRDIFNRPKNRKGDPYGKCDFLTWNKIMKTPGVIKSFAIYVRCLVFDNDDDDDAENEVPPSAGRKHK